MIGKLYTPRAFRAHVEATINGLGGQVRFSELTGLNQTDVSRAMTGSQGYPAAFLEVMGVVWEPYRDAYRQVKDAVFDGDGGRKALGDALETINALKSEMTGLKVANALLKKRKSPDPVTDDSEIAALRAEVEGYRAAKARRIENIAWARNIKRWTAPRRMA